MRCSNLLGATVLLFWVVAPGAGQEVAPSEGEWLRLGSFRGSTSSALLQRLNDYLFEEERSGDLYQDLGDVGLGLGFDIGDDANFDWDNAFHRRVWAHHEDLPPGSTVGDDDLSYFVDIQGTTSRVQVDYTVPSEKVGGVGIGAGVEGGVSLTLARFRKPLVFADRPLAEVLAERKDDDFSELITDQPPIGQRDLLRLTAQGVSAIAKPVVRAFDPVVDTERGLIFSQNAADPITLLGDVGIPVQAELFRARDPRLGVGDRIRHVAFRGISPLRLGYRDFGLRIRYSAFIRAQRRTTIIKEPDDHVLVRVREILAKGHEGLPLKFRPEVRILGIVTLGYTFFEQRLARAKTFAAETSYRIDLADAEGLLSFESLLGEGTKVSYHPLRRAAERGTGAEVVNHQTRRGGRRVTKVDFGIFSPLGFKDRKTLTSDLVQLGEFTLREMSVARSRKFRQRIFGDRDWKKQFLVTAQGPEDWRSYVNEPGDSSARTFTVNMLTGFRSDHIQGSEVRRQIGLLERTLGPHPVLEEVGSIPPGAETRFFSNLRLSFGAAHLKMFEGTGDRELWLELADLFLGSEYRQVWSSEEDRREWSRRYSRKAFREGLSGGLASLSQPREKVLNLKERFRLAKRAVRKFDRLQTLIAEPDCLRCMSKTFTKQKDIVTLQMLLFRLASRDQQNPPGYRYEVFIDPLLRPRSIGNGLSFQHGQLLSDSVIAEPEDLESAERGVAVAQQSAGQSYSGWSGDETFIDSSNPRLQAGEIYLNVGHPGDSDAPAPCWKLRLFSDLQFAADLSLRLDLRISSTFKADQPLGVYLIPLERSTEVVQSPFTLSRFSYDVALPVGPDLQPKTSYTFLMRVINAEGLSVSEEEKVRFEWPAVGFSEAAPNCRGEILDG